MVFKRYIKKDGKLHGPYYYESYRENGVVKKRYLGTEMPRGSGVTYSFSAKPVYILGILLVALLLVAGAVYLAQNSNQMKVNQSKSVIVDVGGKQQFSLGESIKESFEAISGRIISIVLAGFTTDEGNATQESPVE